LGQQNVFPGSGLKQCFVASTKCFFKPTKYFVALKKVKKTPKKAVVAGKICLFADVLGQRGRFFLRSICAHLAL